MNEPTTGEWTARSVFTLYGHPNNVNGWQVVADAHNAALAAERKKHSKDLAQALERILDLEAEKFRNSPQRGTP